MTEGVVLITVFVSILIIGLASVLLIEPVAPKRKLAAALFLLGATGFLWVPWVGFGFQQIYRWNQGMINDLEREEVVLPPDDKVRKSAASTEEEAPETEASEVQTTVIESVGTREVE